MKRSHLFALLSLLLVSTSLFAQFKTKKSAKIIDPGQLYSSYNLSKEEESTIRKQVGDEALSLIKNACHENKWPTGISAFDDRQKAKEIVKKYKAFIVAEFGDKYVLWIPAKKNHKMPEEMQSRNDFFFIIGKKGVS
jgi:Skp family chaperone for outer membrane proteins